MNKNINYGTINKRGGAKNRLFKFVLCFCLGVVSLLGIGAKMTANAEVFDMDTTKVVSSNNEVLSEILEYDFVGYFDFFGTSTSNNITYFELRFYNFDCSLYDVSKTTSPAFRLINTTVSGYMTSSVSQGVVVGAKVRCDYFFDSVDYELSVLTYKPYGVLGSEEYYFCSKVLYNLYTTSVNSSSGYTDTDLQNSYNTGYSDCQKDLVDDLQQQYQDGYNVGKGEGINEGYWQGHEVGYNAGLEDNQDLIYNTGYSDGYSIGKDDGYSSGYSEAKVEYQNDQNNFKDLMFSIIDAPFNVLSNAFDFEIFGINMADFLIAIVSLLLVAVVIRKLM